MQIFRFLLRSRTRWAICWLIVLGAAAFVAEEAWKGFDDPKRRDGNSGHTTIDFGGQWLMGRMFVEGQGRHLYDRDYLRPAAHKGYPAGDEPPNAHKSDAENLMEWLAGRDDSDSRLGGALYPPIQALYYAPLALLRPPIAYRVVQALLLALVFFAGWVVHRMTEGRVWWPVASLFVMMLPGFSGCIILGQNGMITLAVVLFGWWQLMRGRDVLAGLCWGLLAFKPVWAVAFFLVPLITGRRRMAASMAFAGLAQIALTLPFVGWETWRDWLQVGQEAAQEYRRQQNWIFLSRDLLGIPRRWLLTFEEDVAKDLVWSSGDSAAVASDHERKPWDHPLLALLGWGLWGTVLAVTLFVVWRRWPRRGERTGPFPAFVLSGCVLTCYHYMYYDFVVAGLPILLLFTEPARYFQVRSWRWPRCLVTLMPPLLLTLLLAVPAYACIRDPKYRFPPWDTFGLMLLWAWCGYRLLRKTNHRVTENTEKAQKEKKSLTYFSFLSSVFLSVFSVTLWLGFFSDTAQLAELGADVGAAHERLADQHGADAGRL